MNCAWNLGWQRKIGGGISIQMELEPPAAAPRQLEMQIQTQVPE